jgi:glycosyltransferase involved in cell wall biosynthesis
MGRIISVIIPCYKDSLTLARAIDSVLSQTLRINEIIVVNDASPETSAIEAVLSNYPNVVYIKNVHNKGLAASRNIGVNAATGEIISFIDADDELHPQKIEAQMALFQKRTAFSCRVTRISSEIDRAVLKKYTGHWRHSIYSRSSSIIKSNKLTGASLLIEKDLFLSVGGYDESLRSCEDFDLWLRLLDSGIKAVNIELPLYLYRLNNNGLSRNYLEISKWEMAVLKKYFLSKSYSKLYSQYISFIYTFWILKHLVRFEECRDPVLLQNINKNLILINKNLIARLSLVIIRFFKIPSLVFHLRNIKKS